MDQLNMGTMMATRARVYDVLDGERDYQDAQMGNAKRHADMPPMTPGEHLLCMIHLMNVAVAEWYKPDGGVNCLEHVRKMTAMGIQCMERYGAPPRRIPDVPKIVAETIAEATKTP